MANNNLYILYCTKFNQPNFKSKISPIIAVIPITVTILQYTLCDKVIESLFFKGTANALEKRSKPTPTAIRHK